MEKSKTKMPECSGQEGFRETLSCTDQSNQRKNQKEPKQWSLLGNSIVLRNEGTIAQLCGDSNVGGTGSMATLRSEVQSDWKVEARLEENWQQAFGSTRRQSFAMDKN